MHENGSLGRRNICRPKILNIFLGTTERVNRTNIGDAINNILGFQNYLIWDTQFEKVIEFSNIRRHNLFESYNRWDC